MADDGPTCDGDTAHPVLTEYVIPFVHAPPLGGFAGHPIAVSRLLDVDMLHAYAVVFTGAFAGKVMSRD